MNIIEKPSRTPQEIADDILHASVGPDENVREALERYQRDATGKFRHMAEDMAIALDAVHRGRSAEPHKPILSRAEEFRYEVAEFEQPPRANGQDFLALRERMDEEKKRSSPKKTEELTREFYRKKFNPSENVSYDWEHRVKPLFSELCAALSIPTIPTTTPDQGRS